MMLTIDQEVLNAVSDDWESLEQIYRSITLEFSSERYSPDDPASFYWRDSGRGFSLPQISECIERLVREGLLKARREDGSFVDSVADGEVLRCWFFASDLGRQWLNDSIA